jgi:flagellar biosynthesis/type III secretory pathway M-ring protein FliF/YscJ
VSNKKRLNSREERRGNLVSIQPFDNTSRAYKKEIPKRAETSFGFYLTIAIWVFLVIFLFFIYEMVIETWERLK